MKIIRCNDDVLAKIPNIVGLIHDVFDLKEVILYAIVDEMNKLYFVAMNGVNGLYISDKGHRLFSTDLEYNLRACNGKDFNAFYGPDNTQSYVDGKKNEYSITITPLDGLDDEGYSGEVLFNQYHPDKDIFCQLSYPQMYMESDGIPKIYSYHTKVPSSIYIEEENSKDHDRSFGLIDKHIQNYSRYTFERGMIGYNIVLVNKYGLINTLLNSSYVLERENRLRTFTKSRIVFNGQYRDLWPFDTLYDQQYVNSLVEKYGFLLEVPQEILMMNNDQDPMIREIREILQQLKDEKIKEECGMQMVLHQ